MKREGWQHGAKRINSKHSNSLPTSTAEFFTKAVSKPSNQSNYGSKCRKARNEKSHAQPMSKSKGKAKGAYKLKSWDVALNHRLESWRMVVDDEQGAVSASRLLDYLLSGVDFWGDDHDDQGASDHVGKECYDSCDHGEVLDECSSDDGDEEGGVMGGFCEIGFVLVYLDDEGDWCIVDEM